MACFAIALTSCGGKKENSNDSIVLTPETTHIKGDLSDYYEVVDKEYTLTDDFGSIISVEVKRTDKDFDFDLEGVNPYGYFGSGVNAHAGFGIEILDENGTVIEKSSATNGGSSGMYSSDDMKEALKLKAGETGTVRWSFHFDGDKKPAKFRLTSAYEEVSGSSVDSDDDDDSYSSSGSQDWDALLDSYEEYVDKYISYAKKAAKGDISALSEYPALMEKAQEFSEKMQNAQGDMSSSQWSRYMRITNKMTQAAANM